MRELHPFLAFSVVGAIGFLVDAVVLYLLMGFLGPFAGRCLSLGCSMTTTWFINRSITFAGAKLRYTRWIEGAIYMLIMFVGAVVNFFIYVWLVLKNELFHSYPILGIAAGSSFALVWNFSVVRTLLYRRPH